jgi:hypothetical protein
VSPLDRYPRVGCSGTVTPALTLRATGYGDSGLVFAAVKGTPIDAQNIVNRHFKLLLKQEDLPRIRWHDPRATSDLTDEPSSRAWWSRRRRRPLPWSKVSTGAARASTGHGLGCPWSGTLQGRHHVVAHGFPPLLRRQAPNWSLCAHNNKSPQGERIPQMSDICVKCY